MPKLDDGIAVGADAGIHEEVLDILQAAADIVQAVFTFPAFIEFSGDGNRTEFRWKEVLGVFEGQAHLRQTRSRAGAGPVKDQAFEVFGPQVADLLFADDPANAIDDIAFSATVGADDPGDTLVKADMGLIGKTLESLNFQAL